MILRILALYLNSENYKRPLKGFLNSFTAANRDAGGSHLKDAARRFLEACTLLAAGPGPRALRKSSNQVNTAQAEAIFVGLMRRIKVKPVSSAEVAMGLEIIRANAEFDGATGRATADEEQVATRVRVATDIFAAQ